MLVKDLELEKYIPLKTSDSGLTALTWMEEMKVCHWPVVNDEDFLALISDVDIYSQNDPDEHIGNHQLSLLRPYVNENQTIFDALKLFDAHKLSLIPVLDARNRYIGVISINSLLHSITTLLGVNEPGAIIILEVYQNDYLLSQIVQIVESNDTRIMGIQVVPITDSTRLNVVIKLNRLDIMPVLQTFSRYNYTISAYFTDESVEDDIMDRYDEFMKFLNI